MNKPNCFRYYVYNEDPYNYEGYEFHIHQDERGFIVKTIQSGVGIQRTIDHFGFQDYQKAMEAFTKWLMYER